MLANIIYKVLGQGAKITHVLLIILLGYFNYGKSHTAFYHFRYCHFWQLVRCFPFVVVKPTITQCPESLRFAFQ